MAILGEGLFGKQMNHWAGGPAKGIVLTPTSRYRWQVIFHLDDKALGWDIMFNDRNTGNLESELRHLQKEREAEGSHNLRGMYCMLCNFFLIHCNF
jgi:hypothetical protein